MTLSDRTLTLRKIYDFFPHFHILKLLFPSIFCCNYTSDTLSQKKIYAQVSNYICIIHIQSIRFPVITYGMALIYK